LEVGTLLMVVQEDHIQEVVFLDVLQPVNTYTFISVEIKTWTIDFEESQSRLVWSEVTSLLITVGTVKSVARATDLYTGYPWYKIGLLSLSQVVSRRHFTKDGKTGDHMGERLLVKVHTQKEIAGMSKEQFEAAKTAEKQRLKIFHTEPCESYLLVHTPPLISLSPSPPPPPSLPGRKARSHDQRRHQGRLHGGAVAE